MFCILGDLPLWGGGSLQCLGVYKYVYSTLQVSSWHLGLLSGSCCSLGCSMLWLKLDDRFFNCLGVFLPLFITFGIWNEPHAFTEQ